MYSLLPVQENAKALPLATSRDIEMVIPSDGLKETTITMERDLVSKAEEEDMEALLDTYVPPCLDFFILICIFSYIKVIEKRKPTITANFQI